MKGLVRIRSLSGDASTVVNEMVARIQSGSRLHLGRALSLVESAVPLHREQGQAIVKALLLSRNKELHRGPSMRIGITGPPGAGKSTLIEALGSLYAANKENRVAVLCIDPSSAVTGGSIMGDKTRMVRLSQMDNVFIRPASAGKALGGLSGMTHNQVALVESAGYNIVLVETVGVGQSEHAVRTLVDTVVLVLSPAGGDSLQGMKRGLVELCHVIAVNKCDGPLREQANATCSEYRMAVSLFQSGSAWKVPVLRVSSVDGFGLPSLVGAISRHRDYVGSIEECRARNVWEAIWSRVQEQALDALQSHPTVLENQEAWTRQMQMGELTADDVTIELVNVLMGGKSAARLKT